MFQLIAAVIAIALVVVIALALIWYGGDAFKGGADKARYAAYMNHGSQIEGAIKLYQTNNGFTPEGDSDKIVAMLVQGDGNTTYLSSEPRGTWYVESGTIYKSLVDGVDECKRINIVAKGKDAVDTAGGDGCPVCNDATYRDWPGCKRDSMATVGGGGTGTGTGSGG